MQHTCTICKTLTLSINNDQEQWKNYSFYGAKIHAYLKLQTSYAAPESVSALLDESYDPILDSTGDPIIATQAATKDIIETIDKGVYTVTTPEQYSDIINVTALDDMYKANKVYTSGLKLPQSLINLVRDACKTVGIGMNLTMDHGDIIIRSVPDSMTFRQLFGYAAMVESANARIDYSGNLQFVKWDFGKMESDNAATVDADGFIHFGDASPSIDTDGFVSLPGWTINAEGFLALTSGPGSDVQRLMAYANPPALSSDDIVITGIKVTNGQSNDDTETDYSGMYGEEGYVLELENELIDTDQLQTVANIIGEQIVGARFRNLEGDLVYNPLVEFGDMVYTYDRSGNKYLTPLTDVSGNVGGLTTVKTQADDPIRGSSDFYGNSTKAIVAARQMVRKETSAREEAIKRLAETLSSSSGLYMTQEPQQDGSIIYYMHNKATIAESNIIWKLTAEAFAVSIDGGKTYPYGFAVTGELITRLLYAEGINADYINAGNGQLKIYDADGNQISRLGYTGYVVLNKNTGNPMVSLNTAGLRLYTNYTDADNYNALMLGKYGLYAQKVQNKVLELWMEGDTSKKWEGYIVRYLNNKVRINTNSLFTDGCELGANILTNGSLTVEGAAGLKGGAYVQGSFSFEDSEQTDERSPVRRRPIATLGTVGKKVAFIGCGQTQTGGTDIGTSYKNYIEVRGQFTGAKNFVTSKFYSGSAPSDIRLKENIESSETDALETVNRMKVRQFDWKERMGGWHQNIGFVADELEEIDPNLALGGGYDENGEMDIKQINSPYLLNYAIKAIQELSAKVDEQEKRIKELERRLQDGKI